MTIIINEKEHARLPKVDKLIDIYAKKKELVGSLEDNYISHIRKELNLLYPILKETSDVLSNANNAIGHLMDSEFDKDTVNSIIELRNTLLYQSEDIININFFNARSYLGSMFESVFKYFEHLGVLSEDYVEFDIVIGIAEMTIREFVIKDYVSDSQDLIIVSIKDILGMNKGAKFTDVDQFCDALGLCMEMMIDIVTDIVIRTYNRDAEYTTEENPIYNSLCSEWKEADIYNNNLVSKSFWEPDFGRCSIETSYDEDFYAKLKDEVYFIKITN